MYGGTVAQSHRTNVARALRYLACLAPGIPPRTAPTLWGGWVIYTYGKACLGSMVLKKGGFGVRGVSHMGAAERGNGGVDSDSKRAPGWWGETGVQAPPVELDALPPYAWMYVLGDLGPFRRLFLVLTLASVVVVGLNFLAVFIVGEIITNLAHLSVEAILGRYLPLYLIFLLVIEGLDYFLRRYGEAIPSFYADFQRNRFLNAVLQLDFGRSGNIAKERIHALIDRYTRHLELFLDQWFWGLSRKLTEAVIVMAILFYQNVFIGGITVVYLIGFLTLAFYISSRFAPYARDFAAEAVHESTVRQNFVLNLGVVRRFRAGSFLARTIERVVSSKWASFDRLRAFHARRWFLQLNLFNALFIGTFFYGVYQVKTGTLPLGYLVLIKWAFDRLWFAVVLFIEYVVSLVQQREDARLVRGEFALLGAREASSLTTLSIPSTWREIALVNVAVAFPATSDRAAVQIRVPNFVLRRGTWVGIIGPSGVGKSTVLSMLMNLQPTNGGLRVDGEALPPGALSSDFVTVIANTDPLFKLTLRENVVLGGEPAAGELARVLAGVGATDFYGDGASVVGAADFNLSAGQEQRIRLARGLLQASDVYLLDEPFNSIDRATKSSVMRFLGEYLAGRTVVLVTHNPEDLDLVQELYSFEGDVLVPVSRPTRASDGTPV